MCYAIPGKIIGIKDKVVTLEYFGEERKAKNELFDLKPGEYAYAQGGFIIQKIAAREAVPILDSWQELFFKLKDIDSRLSSQPGNLYQRANALRHKYHGNSCCIHGIIEFSNYCRNDCLYCGIRKNNSGLKRYRMDTEEIIAAAEYAVREFAFKALVLQSGEDDWYTEKRLIDIVEGIKKRSPCLITISIGERPLKVYERLYQAGARGVLLRFETSNPSVYAQMRPGHILSERIELIRGLKKCGYLIMTGFLIGLPGLTKEDIIKDIALSKELGTEMFSFGPFIPHPQTPLAKVKPVSLKDALGVIAQARLTNPKAKILVTTAMETLDKQGALRDGLLAGANSVMINVTAQKYRPLYEIYPERAGTDMDIRDRIASILKLLHSIGRAPTDLGL